MKKKILYHLLRKSDYIFALTNGKIRNSQLLSAIFEIKHQLEFDEINCVAEMDGESFDEIIEGAKTLSANRKNKKNYSIRTNFQNEVKSENLKECDKYHIQTQQDGSEFTPYNYLTKRNIEGLINLTEKFYRSKLPNIKDFMKVKNLSEDQAEIIKKIQDNEINNDIYILNDWTGEVFKDFYEYNDPELPQIKFIINKNEFPTTKSTKFNFKKNIFGTCRVPVNYILKMLKSLKKYNIDKLPYHKILTNDKKFIEKLRYAKFIAELNQPVLILGDTGTGKDLLAEGMHYESKRSFKPFVVRNCSAFPDSLFESEMFGYEKGSFTGADKQKKGAFEEANGGTLFLDEIGDLSLLNQAKVLRVLQDKKFTRIGGSEVIKVDFRLICATNKDIIGGDFRSDLLYRISMFTIELPPLIKRHKSDIEMLVSHFTDSIKDEYLKYFSIEYSKKAIKIIKNYRWPGNARQLNSFVNETFFWTAFKATRKFSRIPIKNLDPNEPVYNTYESVRMGEPNYQGEEPLHQEKPIIIDDDFVNQYIENQKKKEAKNKYSDSDIYSKIIDENIALRDLPQGFNILSIIDEIIKNYLKKLINAGMLQKEIAIIFGVTQQTISNWFKKYGIK